MLSNEERKAIGEVKHFNQITRYWQEEEYEEKEIAKYITIVLNLIEKQSKEIEELKEKNRQGKMRIVQLENEITARIEDVNQYYTPNDKIKAKIEEKFLEAKGLYERGVQPQAQYTMKLLRDLEKSLLEKE